MKTHPILLLFVLSLGSVRGQNQAPVPSLSVTGNAEVRVTPDQAHVRLGVTQEGSTAQEAQQKANTIGEAILSGLRQLGIDPKRIQTAQLTLYPIYTGGVESMRNEKPRIVGYRASNVVSVIVDKIEQVGPVVDAGLKAGSNQVEGISFGLKDDSAVREQALAEAAVEARSKANAIAKALNVQILGIQEVTEGGVSIVPVMARADMMMAKSELAPPPVAPGEVTVNATLTVKYQITK